jgi:hypothetical protein
MVLVRRSCLRPSPSCVPVEDTSLEAALEKQTRSGGDSGIKA